MPTLNNPFVIFTKDVRKDENLQIWPNLVFPNSCNLIIPWITLGTATSAMRTKLCGKYFGRRGAHVHVNMCKYMFGTCLDI